MKCRSGRTCGGRRARPDAGAGGSPRLNEVQVRKDLREQGG